MNFTLWKRSSENIYIEHQCPENKHSEMSHSKSNESLFYPNPDPNRFLILADFFTFWIFARDYRAQKYVWWIRADRPDFGYKRIFWVRSSPELPELGGLSVADSIIRILIQLLSAKFCLVPIRAQVSKLFFVAVRLTLVCHGPTVGCTDYEHGLMWSPYNKVD